MKTDRKRGILRGIAAVAAFALLWLGAIDASGRDGAGVVIPSGASAGP
ncbi:MAG: hypothetical protein KIT54_06050 [Phycisphaeraceae bacterium]|nr:hypothetical protein [Phycisphaeraceae bacterium]